MPSASDTVTGLQGRVVEVNAHQRGRLLIEAAITTQANIGDGNGFVRFQPLSAALAHSSFWHLVPLKLAPRQITTLSAAATHCTERSCRGLSARWMRSATRQLAELENQGRGAPSRFRSGRWLLGSACRSRRASGVKVGDPPWPLEAKRAGERGQTATLLVAVAVAN